MHKFRSALWRVLRVILLVYLGILILLAVLQRKLTYLQTRMDAPEMLEYAGRVGLRPWLGNDGSLIGWRADDSAIDAPNRLIVFHGNAGFAALREHFVFGFGPQWEVFVLEYPGYGSRPGKPSEETINAAAESAFLQLREEDDRPIFVAGESLGSGPACALAAKFPNEVKGILLVTPYTSLPDVGARHYPFLPVRLLMLDQFDNVSALAEYRGPVAFLLAGADEVVSTELGETLYESYDGPKWLHVIEGVGHNGIDHSRNARWRREASDFLLSP